MIALDTSSSRSIHKSLCAHNIGSKKYFRIFYRTVNMTFRGKIYHYVKSFFFKQLVYKLAVCYISPDKFEMFARHCFVKRLKISCIGEQIEAYDVIIRMLVKHVIDKITSDKASSASNQNLHFNLHAIRIAQNTVKRRSFVPYVAPFFLFLQHLPLFNLPAS